MTSVQRDSRRGGPNPVRKTSGEAPKTRRKPRRKPCAARLPEATHQATSKRRGDAEGLRARSITESTQTRSYPRRITDGRATTIPIQTPRKTRRREVSFPPILGYASTSPRTSSLPPGPGRLRLFPNRRFTLDTFTGWKGLAAAWTFWCRGLRLLETLAQLVELRMEACLDGLPVLQGGRSRLPR